MTMRSWKSVYEFTKRQGVSFRCARNESWTLRLEWRFISETAWPDVGDEFRVVLFDPIQIACAITRNCSGQWTAASGCVPLRIIQRAASPRFKSPSLDDRSMVRAGPRFGRVSRAIGGKIHGAAIAQAGSLFMKMRLFLSSFNESNELRIYGVCLIDSFRAKLISLRICSGN